jgi:purine nucleosidase/pyrimidine-specific ribonucleoside hydrolase
MQDKKIKIIIDTDIGDDIDDAFALEYAIKDEHFNILGVTTVYKNCLQRAQMAKKILHLHGLDDIGVYCGYDKPIKEDVKKFICEHYNKQGGIDLLSYRRDLDNYKVNDKSAVDFIIESIKNNPYEVVLYGLGPMTNIAYAIQKDPETMKLVKEIIVMSGNREGILEYNLMIDPEAAKILYDSGLPLRLVGGNVTMKCIFNQRLLHRCLAIKTPSMDYINEMMMEWISYNMRPPIMHDALTISVLLHNYVTFKPLIADVQLETNRGHIKPIELDEMQAGAHLASLSVDNKNFLEHFFEMMEK